MFFGGFFNLYGSVAVGRVCQFWDFLFAGAREREGGAGAGGGVGGVVVVKDQVQSLGDGSTEL